MGKRSQRIAGEIEHFKKGINKGPLHSSDWNDYETNYDNAIYQAYLDAARTFKWINKALNEEEDSVKRLLESIPKSKTQSINQLLSNYFNNKQPADESEFDKTHSELCDFVISLFEEINYKDIKYGQAQKIVNMAFKYLYCFDDAPEEYFTYCHMPFDFFTLEWIYRNILSKDKTCKKGKIASWSKLEKTENDEYKGADGKLYYSYDFYVKKVREYLADTSKKFKYNGWTPLQLEFKIWPEIQMDLAAEAFWSALNPDADKDEKIKFQKKETQEKLETIKNCIIA